MIFHVNTTARIRCVIIQTGNFRQAVVAPNTYSEPPVRFVVQGFNHYCWTWLHCELSIFVSRCRLFEFTKPKMGHNWHRTVSVNFYNYTWATKWWLMNNPLWLSFTQVIIHKWSIAIRMRWKKKTLIWEVLSTNRINPRLFEEICEMTHGNFGSL